MVNHENRSRRIWTDGGVVYLRDEDANGEQVIREFWVPPGGGYVREIDNIRPGTLGRQVCRFLEHRGSTLSCDEDRLLHVIRREYRRSIAANQRDNARYSL